MGETIPIITLMKMHIAYSKPWAEEPITTRGETSSGEHVGKDSKVIYGLIDDMIVTTAHRHDLLFQPSAPVWAWGHWQSAR